ncbi:MAG TPA: hypothetical protein VEF04_00125 [Blastocatellia bacterium]|nr:hypothetical protein [Blastocatellia bacterium]
MKTNKQHWIFSGLLCLSLTIAFAFADSRPATPQDLLTLDRRVNVMEQRLYSIESRLNQIERLSITSQRSATPAQSNTDTDAAILRSEIEILTNRLRLIECGVIRLDQRTLPAQAREALRKSGGQASDSCRMNTDDPLIFPH